MKKNSGPQSEISFTDEEVILMGKMQPFSFYWNLKKKIIGFLLARHV